MRAARLRLAPVVLGVLGCGRDVAQTAFREPPSAESPRCSEPMTSLPPAPSWAAGELTKPSESYGAGEGPGLWLSARDAYRVYLNGALVAESREPRRPDFVPLSLLPGDNVVAVAIWAKAGPPAALLQLDDLSQSYASDESWSVEASPRTGFDAAGYDVSRAASATSLGRLGALPGCDPSSDFPTESVAQWLAPSSGSSALLRRVIRVAPVGFGEAATGGDSTAPIIAETWEQLQELASEADTPTVIVMPEGVYDFRRKGDELNARLVCPSGTEDPEKTQFTVLTPTETCPVTQVMKTLEERRLSVGSNKTIVGLGRGALLRGVSLDLGAQQNIIIRNLALYDVNRGLIEAGDGIGIAGAKDVWLDHMTTKWISDGHTDIAPGSQNITLSWMHYDGLSTEACRGRHTHASTINGSSVTLHHCFFDHTDSHAPLVSDSRARVHVFNDLIQDNASYGVGSACGAQVLLEGTAFKAVMTPTARRGCSDTGPIGSIDAPQGSNLLLGDVGKHAGGDGQEPHDSVFEPPYEVIVEPAAEAWPRVQGRAGTGGPWPLPLSVDP
jgi:pectate lyase